MSISKTRSATNVGLLPQEVEIEVDISNGLPALSIVGLPDKAVEESKERVRSAIKNSHLIFPDRRITVNLAPADLKKEGPIFDLAVAIGLLGASGQTPSNFDDSVFVGELSLDGSLRHTSGILPIVHESKLRGYKKIYVPFDNLKEAQMIEGIEIFAPKKLSELYLHLKGEKQITPYHGEIPIIENEEITDFDISYIKGQGHAKRALEIAAAGGHNLLFSGPPGSGKTMLARSLVSILPPLSPEEVVEVTKIYSVTGLLKKESPLIKRRPFRSPHHTSSDISLVGGGRWPKPGEITLAHRGVLFLDELPEFSRSVLEVLRQPLEDGEVNVSRASGSVCFPAQILLIASQNPCPCGYLGDDRHSCRCGPAQIARYERKISGPLLDRIDLHLTVPRVEIKDLSKGERIGESSGEVKERVIKARVIQKARYKNEKIILNSEMSQRHIEKYLSLNEGAKKMISDAAESLALSARAYFRVLKISRTIADLSEKDIVDIEDVAEALQYRSRGR